jgi:hypothetical protein
MKALAILLLSLTSLTSSNPGINGIKIVTRQMMGGLTDIRTEYVAGDSDGKHCSARGAR